MTARREASVTRQGLIQVREAWPAMAPDRIPAGHDLATAMRRARVDGRGPIYVVDDDDWVCDSLAVLLETYGFAVQAYNSSERFLADRERDAAKCLVIDQHMRGLDGLGVVAELRRQSISAPTIMITGRLDPGIARRAAALGIIEVIEKPFAVARLIEQVQHALGPRD